MVTTPTQTTRLPARYVALLLDYLAGTGVDPTPLLRSARVRSIDDPAGLLTIRQVDAVFRAATQATGRTDLGFELGRMLDPTTHDLLGFALLTSSKFGEMLRLGTMYQRLLQTAFTLSLHRHADLVELVYVPAVAMPAPTMRVLAEVIVVSNHVAFRSTLGERLPRYDVWMSIERPAHAARYRELAPARVHFGDAVPGVRIALPARLLDVPLAMANPRTMRAAEQRCRSLMRIVHTQRRWSDWCQMMLRESGDARPTLPQLARIANVSSRTLTRYLYLEGTRFREIALATRVERATELLTHEQASVTQVAYWLGYGDVASFVRAYRRSTGRTPGSVARR